MSSNSPTLALLLNAMLLTLGLVSFVYSARAFLRKESTPGPQKSRQIARIAVGPLAAGIVIMLVLGQLRPEKRVLSLLMVPPLIVFALRFAWDLMHEPTEADAVANFAHDREHCGRCGYSVTGNVTGTCSECGWTYPAGELPTEEPDWSAWWRKWRIQYLRHYVWNLTSYIGIGSWCFAMAAYFRSQGNTAPAVVIALVGVHLFINALRVIQYLLRRRRRGPGNAEPNA